MPRSRPILAEPSGKLESGVTHTEADEMPAVRSSPTPRIGEFKGVWQGVVSMRFRGGPSNIVLMSGLSRERFREFGVVLIDGVAEKRLDIICVPPK